MFNCTYLHLWLVFHRFYHTNIIYCLDSQICIEFGIVGSMNKMVNNSYPEKGILSRNSMVSSTILLIKKGPTTPSLIKTQPSRWYVMMHIVIEMISLLNILYSQRVSNVWIDFLRTGCLSQTCWQGSDFEQLRRSTQSALLITFPHFAKSSHTMVFCNKVLMIIKFLAL